MTTNTKTSQAADPIALIHRYGAGEAAHTPDTHKSVSLASLTPLSIGQNWKGACDAFAVCDLISGDYTVCRVYGFTVERARDGAEQIRRACNSHAALVAALEKALTWAETYARQCGIDIEHSAGPLSADIGHARAALAAAKESQP